MFKNTFQSGFLSILYSLGSKPLQIWDKEVSMPGDKVLMSKVHHAVQITTIRLNGHKNYHRWSQSVQMYIRAQGMFGYLTGDKKEPAKTDPLFATWDVENYMVMTWLVNSMIEEISDNYMYFSTAKQLWESVSKMYSDLGNPSRILELNKKLGNIRQGENNVIQYYHSLNRIWQDLDIFDVYEWESTKDHKHYKKVVEDGRIYKFLIGLNDEYDEVRSRVTSKNPLPSIGDVFSEVRREESRRSVMLGKKIIESVEASAMVVDATANKASIQVNKPRWCNYCNKPRHTRETCWTLNGKPANWKKSSKQGDKRNSQQPSSSAHVTESNQLSKEQVDQLLKLLKTNLTFGNPSVSLA